MAEVASVFRSPRARFHWFITIFSLLSSSSSIIFVAYGTKLGSASINYCYLFSSQSSSVFLAPLKPRIKLDKPFRHLLRTRQSVFAKRYWCHYIMDLYGHLLLLMTQYTVWILTTRHKIFEVLFVFALPLSHSFRFMLWLALKWGQNKALMAKVED